MSPKKTQWVLLVLTVGAAHISTIAHAEQHVYSSIGFHGEVRFSDQPSTGAALFYVFAPPASAAEAQRIRSQTQKNLELANTMEASRLKREAAYRESIARPAVAQHPGEQTDFQPREYRNRFFDRQHYYNTPHRPFRTHRAPAVGPEVPRRPFAPAFKPVAPALQQ